MKATRDFIEKQFRSLDDFYLDIIRRHEYKLQADLRNYEALIAHSWKWRVGTSLVCASVNLMNFLGSPVRYFKDKSYRDSWKGLSVKASPGFQFVPVLGSDALVKKPQLVLPVEEDKKTENQEVTVTEKQPAVTSGEALDFMAVILDNPTTRLLSSYGHVFPLKPEGFAEQLDHSMPLFFLCESANRGNGGAWQYKLVGENGLGSVEIQQLLTECKARAIPTFFWMTSTSSSAGRFLPTANLFDFILSPHKEPAGSKPAQHRENIHYFPHAIDPGIHHPITDGSRKSRVCFIFDSSDSQSTYNTAGVIEFLKPAMKSGMDAFDISFGESPGDQNHFPLIREHNRGYLPYLKMAEQYRKYMALLNVSPAGQNEGFITRSIFEALASGLPVISGPNALLKETFGDVILFAETGAEVATILDRLQNDRMFIQQQVVKGIRAVMSTHLISFRLRKMKMLAGLTATTAPEPKICLMIDVGEEQGLDDLIRCILCQTRKPDAVAFFMHTSFPESSMETITSELRGMQVISFIYYQHQLYQPVRERMNCDYYMIWQRGCVYGDHYIEDYLLALRYSPYNVLCKRSHFVQAGDQVNLVDPDNCFCRVTRAPLSTVMMGRDQLTGFNFLQMADSGANYDAFDERMVSLDPMNYLKTDISSGRALHPLWKELNI